MRQRQTHELFALTERTLLLHVKEGSVEHHQRGQPRSQEVVHIEPLDVAAASQPSTYTLTGPDGKALSPTAVGRKSKGTDFAWFVDKWENNHTVNTRPDHVKEHWLYLTFPTPLREGATYNLGFLGKTLTLTYALAASRSEAVHVNSLGYVPDAPQKFAYLYHWLGDQGGLDVRTFVGRPFHLVSTATGKRVFTGKVAFRLPKTQQETQQLTDTPGGNFLAADVAECDFSAFRTPGRYVIAIEGVGCSWPFQIAADVYRPAFVATARALYHNRSGIALKKPYTEFERPAPHHPKLTPGFAGKLRYTRLREHEWGSEGGDAKKLLAESPGALTETWGWYQDAGDWDGYETHLRVAQELLLVYAMAPQNFTDGELNLPESGNGIPDILDEAAWLPRYCHRLRHELVKKGWGTGGLGLRVSGDAFGSDEGKRPDGTLVGRGSWEDTDRIWMVSGEDPWSTYRYAGVAANLARFNKKDPQGVDWTKEARECYAWAAKNTRPGDEDAHLKEVRAYAAASLFALTGEPVFEKQLEADTISVTPDSLLWEQAAYAPAIYTLHGTGKPALQARLRAALLHTAEEQLIRTPARRALRWGGNFGMPMLIGQQTTPWILEGAVGYALTKNPAYRAALYTTCDYFLGTNALNQTWITGVGPRFPTQIFHMDAWYNGKGKLHPGLIPYSPWRKQRESGQGPWDADWPNATVYPSIDQWPGNERWFSNRCSPMASEFTVHQNIGPAAAIFGFLCASKRGTRQ